MRPENPESNLSQNSPNSQSTPLPQGFLTDCMVDADPTASARAGRARGRAIGISAIAQACLLSVILIVPLFATSHAISVRNAVPIAAYGGIPRRGQEATPNDAIHRSAERHHVVSTGLQFNPPSKKNNRNEAADDESRGNSGEAPSIGLPTGDSHGNSDRPGLILMPGFNNGLPPLPEPEKKSAPKPIAVSEVTALAQLIRRVEPVYPKLALYRRMEGTVQLQAIIGRGGAVRELQVLSGDAILAFAAQEAVKQWRFRPTMLNGQPVEVDTFFTVIFKIKQQ